MKMFIIKQDKTPFLENMRQMQMNKKKNYKTEYKNKKNPFTMK